MALHVLVCEEAAYDDVKESAAEGNEIEWVVPKSARPGDDSLLFFPHLKGFVGHAEITTAPQDGMFGNRKVFRAKLLVSPLFRKVVPLTNVAGHFPDWGWPRYPRSLNTPDPAIGTQLLPLVQKLGSNNDGKNVQVRFRINLDGQGPKRAQ